MKSKEEVKNVILLGKRKLELGESHRAIRAMGTRASHAGPGWSAGGSNLSPLSAMSF